MKFYINSGIVIMLTVFGTFCIVSSLMEHNPDWAIAAGVLWVAIALRGKL